MKRDYTTGITDTAIYFIGKEVEHTPAYGLKTLFVVGLQPVENIEKLLTDAYLSFGGEVKHIFFGANHSYDPQTGIEYDKWDEMISYFLNKEYYCSLDIAMKHVEEFNDSSLCEHNNFIPQIRVPIPFIKLWNYNTMIKIDDKDFNHSNPGVWTHSLHNLMNREVFTDWQKYKGDEILK